MVRDLCSKRTAADKIMNKMNENRKIVLDTLNEQNIEYEMFEHQAVYTVDEIEDSDLWNHENGIGAKNLFLRDGSGKHHFLVIIREDKQADLKKVRDWSDKGTAVPAAKGQDGEWIRETWQAWDLELDEDGYIRIVHFLERWGWANV